MQELLDLLIEIVLWAPRKLWDEFTDMILFLLDAIPDPGFQQYVDNIMVLLQNQELLYIFGVFRVVDGISLHFMALIARFILRRIPGIG